MNNFFCDSVIELDIDRELHTDVTNSKIILASLNWIIDLSFNPFLSPLKVILDIES